MRICAYGWISRDAGSVASAGFFTLEGLLNQGVEIDLLANPNHVADPEFQSPTFRYLPVQTSWEEVVKRSLPWQIARLADPILHRRWGKLLAERASASHAERAYDVLLGLGTAPPFTIAGVPSVAWLQASPQTELEAIRSLKSEIIASHGRLYYYGLVLHYATSIPFERATLRKFEALIVGSEWSKSKLVDFGIAQDRVDALPYPIDLARFALAPQPRDSAGLAVLCLGRMDPRKRVELLLDAFPIVLRAFPHSRLHIVGREGYGRGIAERASLLPYVTYSDHVPQRSVPGLLRDAAVVVQPSINENFGSTVAEALAVGTPVVVGATNGTADYLPDSSAIFANGTPESLAEAIIAVLRGALRDRGAVAAQSRAAAERLFSTEQAASQLLAILRRCVD